MMMKKLLAASLAVLLILAAGCGSAPSPEEPPVGPESSAGQSQPEASPSDPAPAAEPSQSEVPAEAENYFDAHSIPVADGPQDGAMSGVIYNPEAYDQEGMQEPQDFTHTVLACYTEPAEDGFRYVHYIEEVKMSIKDYDGLGLDATQELIGAYFTLGLYDLYTGVEFPVTSLHGDMAGAENTLTVQVGGASYEVTFSREQEWTFGPWALTPDLEYGYSNGACVSHTIVKVPEGYDGLVFGRLYLEKVTDEQVGQFGDGNETEPDEEPAYAAEYEDWERSHYFRLNGPNTPVIPASDPTGPDPFLEGSEPYFYGIEGQ